MAVVQTMPVVSGKKGALWAQTVFLVDDAREVRTALSRVLSAAGYPVRDFCLATQNQFDRSHIKMSERQPEPKT